VTKPYLDQLPLAGTLVGTNFDGWSIQIREDFARNEFNGRVGSTLTLANDRVRIWDITLAPGQRVNAHRHVLDYFWIAVESGRSRQHTHDGTTREVHYEPGETRFYTFDKGEFLLHDLENIGSTPLKFITVELMSSANAPIAL
jgi:mannose-6-phosphate isomerase-like protein (cupin superfamily)